MNKLLKTSLLGAAAAVALGAFAASASADPITFTWDPAAAGAAGAGDVTATNIIVSDFANASITNASGAFQETGVLWVQSFQLDGGGTPAVGLDNGGGGTYQLFFTFSAAGTGSFGSGGSFNGNVSSLNFSMEIDPTADDTISNRGGVGPHTLTDPSANDIVLATGSLASGPTPSQVNITGGIPGASSTASFIPTAAGLADGFFVNPAATAYLALVIEDSFTNTAGQETVTPGLTTTSIDIHGGGGNADFTVPEPATMSIFGAGLVALGFAKRRQAKKNA